MIYLPLQGLYFILLLEQIRIPLILLEQYYNLEIYLKTMKTGMNLTLAQVKELADTLSIDPRPTSTFFLEFYFPPLSSQVPKDKKDKESKKEVII